MDDLYRDLAPISAAAWDLIEEEAKRTLARTLAARKLVDFEGPLGRAASALPLGRLAPIEGGIAPGVEASLRRVQPLLELRVPFDLSRGEIEAVGRGAEDPDLAPVIEAAQRLAHAEDHAVFHGFVAAQIAGIAAVAPHTLTITENYLAYPSVVAEALGRLRHAGIAGPYAIALGPRCFKGLTETAAPGGYPVVEHVRRLIDGPIVWAPAVNGAVVLSLRGGDFALTVGQDIAIGYLAHDMSRVRLFLEESFTFRVLTPEAAVALSYGRTGGGA